MKKILGTLFVCIALCSNTNAQGIFKGIKDSVDSAKKAKESVEKVTSSSKKKKAAAKEDETVSNGEIVLEGFDALCIYLNLSDTQISDEVYLDYAKIAEYDTYRKYIDDEFEWYDKFEEIKASFNKKIENANVDGKFIIAINVTIGDYDFKNEGYPFKISPDTYFPLRPIGYYNYNVPSANLFRNDIALKLSGLEKYNFLPMGKDEAKAFLQGRKNSSGNINRTIALVCHYEIADFNSKEFQDFERLCGKSYTPLVGTLSSVEIYDSTSNLVKLADAAQK